MLSDMTNYFLSTHEPKSISPALSCFCEVLYHDDVNSDEYNFNEYPSDTNLKEI